MTDITVERSNGPFGAVVHGIDLREPISAALADRLRGEWLTHQVLVFPDQQLGFAELEAVAEASARLARTRTSGRSQASPTSWR